ncbi:MAG: hypothetical protein LUG85_08970 [Clostridiales bacterium]|nr:hypothetical protein [Clostridiales bacterium]
MVVIVILIILVVGGLIAYNDWKIIKAQKNGYKNPNAGKPVQKYRTLTDKELNEMSKQMVGKSKREARKIVRWYTRR